MRFWTMLALVALPTAAVAQTAPPNAQGDVAVTIYNNDLALVRDTRNLVLPAGRTRQEFADVSASIRPETVTLTAEGIGIVEQNFDYDLLAPAKLMDKAVGQDITLVRTNPATGAETREVARVLANNGGTILQIGNRIEILQNLGARVVFSSLPPNLRARPTLSITLDSANAGARPVTLNYLSRGLGWKADYVALFDERAGKLNVQGWVTLSNNSGTTFAKANTLLVAGAVGGSADDSRQSFDRNGYAVRSPRGNQPGTETAKREQIGDFYVYPLAERTTIANAQTKQVSFLDVAGASASKAYFFRNNWLGKLDMAASVDTVLRFTTSRDGGLGDALPAGTVRVYMRDARGSPQFIGESAIGHTPMGSSLALKTGEAFDVKVQPVVTKREHIDGKEFERTFRYRVTDSRFGTREVSIDYTIDYWRTTMTYHVTNARAVPVTVDFAQAGLDNDWHDTRVSSETLPGEQDSADERVWHVPVPANGETTLTVAFDTRY
jgi:hypothetical protein